MKLVKIHPAKTIRNTSYPTSDSKILFSLACALALSQRSIKANGSPAFRISSFDRIVGHAPLSSIYITTTGRDIPMWLNPSMFVCVVKTPPINLANV